MSSAPVAALIIALTLAAVLLTSGIAKLRDARATRDAFDALRVPKFVPLDVGAAALPWVEIGLAVLLLVAPSGWLVPVTLALLLLMLAYAGIIARSLSFDEPVRCSCFGSLGRHEVDRTTLGRNVLLVALAVIVVWYALDGGSAPEAFSDIDRGGWWALIAAAAAAAIAVLVTGGGSGTSAPLTVDELLPYDRAPIPYGVLTLADGRTATLSELTATQARLLVVLNPACGPCVRTAEKLDDWAARLAPAVGLLAVYVDGSSVGGHADHLTAIEPEANVRRVFSVGAPGAVLLGADGLMAGGPVAGEGSVARFVQDVLDTLDQPSVSEPS